MKKYLTIAVLTLLTVGLLCGSAFAAASLNAGNTTIASELVPASGTPIPVINTAWEPGGAIASTTQIKLTLANGTFTGGTIDLCNSSGTSYLTVSPTPITVGSSGTATSVTLTTNNIMTSGQTFYFKTGICTAGSNIPAPLTNVSIAAGAGGGTVVSLTVDDALNPGAANVYATAPIVTVSDQLAATLVTTVPTYVPAVTDIIDFGAVPVMTKFKAGGTNTVAGTTSVARVSLTSNENIATKLTTGLANNTTCGTYSGTESLTFTVTPGGTATTMGTGFHASTAFTAQGSTTPAAIVLKAAIASTDTSASGVATLAANLVARACPATATAANKGAEANNLKLNLVVDGTTVLTPRSYKLAVATNTSGGILAASRTILAATTAWNWTMDASQYYIPLIGTATGRETYIKLQSKNVSAGSNGVTVAILASDGSTAATWTGTITAGTPLTISGAQLAAAAVAAGKTVDGVAGFAAIVTVNAPATDVFAYANMIDSQGAKRIPVKTVGGTIVE